jgi:hypothetical protein
VLAGCLPILLLLCLPALADEQSNGQDITEITVSARRIANTQPAGTYAAPVTMLRFDPLTELQSRGMAEGQSDVTVRGGVFENTGFKLGAVTIMDPQTGHYVAELPVDPALLSMPDVVQGIDGAVEGFNSAVATVSYAIPTLGGRRSVRAGIGNDGLSHQAANLGHIFGNGLGIAFSAARSEGDGTRAFGDHEFSRYNLQLQLDDGATRSDLIISYQDKFFGWPGAYTGFASLPETDDTQTSLILLNQRREHDDGWFEYGGFFRQLRDDYDFDRATLESGIPGSFEHKTRVTAFGFQGRQRAGRVDWRYGGQLTRDELVRSTDLTNGSFTKRSYATLSVVPSLKIVLSGGDVLTWRAGATVDYSNRDSDDLSPLLGVTLERPGTNGTTVWTLEFAKTTQLPGYTALKSNPAGLFGGNSSLGRETAKQLSASVEHDRGDWQARATLFHRRDDDLVDWTYTTGAPFARQANAVDIDVIGLETFITRRWIAFDLAAGFTVLDKDSDYGNAQVDASFYALNFARQRVTLAMQYRFAGQFELLVDTQYRRQEANPLRVGDDSAFLASAALIWNGQVADGLTLSLVADNLTDSEFQTFPGTPAPGRQYSISVDYTW